MLGISRVKRERSYGRPHAARDDELSQGLVRRRAMETAASSLVTRGKPQKLSFFFIPSLAPLHYIRRKQYMAGSFHMGRTCT
jgi:hypothetical protein